MRKGGPEVRQEARAGGDERDGDGGDWGGVGGEDGREPGGGGAVEVVAQLACCFDASGAAADDDDAFGLGEDGAESAPCLFELGDVVVWAVQRRGR